MKNLVEMFRRLENRRWNTDEDSRDTIDRLKSEPVSRSSKEQLQNKSFFQSITKQSQRQESYRKRKAFVQRLRVLK